MKFTIYRKSWRRGGDSKIVGGVEQAGKTKLLNDENMFCCLGMCAIEHGVKPNRIQGISSPDEISMEDIPRKTILYSDAKMMFSNSQLSEEAMNINDDEFLTEEQRERKLTAIFRKRGHELEFVNRLAPKSWRVAGKE